MNGEEVMMKKGSIGSKVRVVLVILLFVIVIVVALVLHVKSIQKLELEYNQINQEMSDRLAGATRTAYKALADIPRGQIVTEDLLTMDSNTLCDDTQTLLMSAEDIGKEAIVDISAGEIITSSMVTNPLSQDWQEVELYCIWLSTNLKQYDEVDVRILFPNGTDYIVLPKEKLRKLKLQQNNVFLWLTEDEILLLDSAIVDANLHGAKIYTTKYVKPEVEDANEITYQPTKQIIDLMNSDPNVLIEAKQNLSKSARAEMLRKIEDFKKDVKELEEGDRDSEWNFELDTTTEASTITSADPEYSEEEELLEDSGSIIDDARNMEGYEEQEGFDGQ